MANRKHSRRAASRKTRRHGGRRNMTRKGRFAPASFVTGRASTLVHGVGNVVGKTLKHGVGAAENILDISGKTLNRTIFGRSRRN